MKFIRTTNMSRLDWLKLRTQGIGGSDVSAILGMNNWRSPYQVWAEKTGRLILDDTEDNEFIHWGNIMEPILAKEFEDQTGKKVFRPNKEFIHPKYDFLRANIDRDIAKEPGFLEIKTAMEYKSSEWDGDEVPVPYILQVQHYMNVLNRPYVYFCALIGGHKTVIKEVERDQELIDTFTPKLVDWWQEYVVADKKPPVDGSNSTTQTLRELFKTDDGETIKLTESLNGQLRIRKQLKQSGDELSSQVSLIDNQIREAMGTASEAENDSFKITYRANKKGTRILRIKEK
ncbi:YqaJ viral recombinase family nuclease [Lapidilactobacillus wuchangensis]|uniref:YqaJ viral recombinase family nuclease n=1 Tax=Lapidilactobacillus wuchangensis TaxID=2486001 RepID=UPI000F7760BF|nr:YqaJ viral recombinase family protein [Lapidilactobacillus wuchangensis]